MGPYHTQPRGPCRHVFLLLPNSARRQSLVETVHHRLTDSSIRHRPWRHILRLLHSLHA